MFAAVSALPTPEPEPASYRYLAATLRDNRIVEELPLTNVRASLLLNQPGPFSATVDTRDLDSITRQGILDATDPGRSVVYIERDGVILGGWIIWSRGTRDLSSEEWEISGATIESWLNHVPIFANATHAGVDQLTIARSLVVNAQSQWGSIAIVTPVPDPSGVAQSQEYIATDLTLVGDALADLSSIENGFDWAIDCAYGSSGLPTRTLNLNYPRRGTNSGILLEFTDDGTGQFSGNIESYQLDEDGTNIATTVLGTGKGEGITKLLTLANNLDLGVAYPALVKMKSYSQESDPVRLLARVRAEAAISRTAELPPKITIRADAVPVLGSYRTGDYAQIVISEGCPGFPRGVQATWRIVGIAFTPGVDNERVQLTVGPVSE